MFFQPLLAALILRSTTAQTVQSSDELPFPISLDTIEEDPDYTAPIFPILPFNQFASNPTNHIAQPSQQLRILLPIQAHSHRP